MGQFSVEICALPGSTLSGNQHGVGLSALAVLILEQTRDTIRNPADVTSRLGLPLLGSVPLSKEEPVEDLNNIASSLSEAYFSVRTTLAFATNHGLPRTML
ncbi:MAG: hypothetical protein R3D03_24490, partial [Geminicoccaceae bacterium]